jgi:hypothetical protein
MQRVQPASRRSAVRRLTAVAAGAALLAHWACASSSSPADTPDGSAAVDGGGASGTAGASGNAGNAGAGGAGGSLQDAAAPESGADADSGTPCAVHDGGSASCLGTCAAGELCFTQVTCSPAPDGGPCSVAGGTDGDDKCHPACDANKQCPAGLVCQIYPFFGCTDFNGFPDGKEICCPPAGCGK